MAGITELRISSNIQNVTADFDKLISHINSSLSKPFNLNININQIQQQLNQVSQATEKVKSNLSSGITSNIQTDTEKMAKAIEQYQRSLNISLQGLQTKYGSLVPQEEFTRIQNAVKELNASDMGGLRSNVKDLRLDISQLTADTKSSSSALRLANQDAKSFFGTFATDMVKFSIWQGVATTFMQSINQIKSAISYLNELNTSQVNISMVTDMQMSKVQELTKSYSELSKQLGEDNSQMNKGAENLLRAGLEAGNEVNEMLKETTVASKLSGTSSDEMSNYLIAVKNGFHLEVDEISKVVDALSTLDNKSSTSFANIVESMQRSSASSNQVGVSYQKLASYVTTVADITHKSAETIGESYKTIFQRMTNVKSGMKDEDQIGINDVEKVLDRQQIKLRETSGQWRNMGDVISDIANKWKSMDSVSQSQVSTAIAGVRQAETFMTLMQNWGKEQQYETDILTSQGSAWEKYQTYLNSTAAKINVLKTSLHDMYTSILNSNTINEFVSGVTVLVDKFGNLKSMVTLVGTAFALWKGTEILGFFTKLPTNIMTTVRSTEVFKVAIGAMQLQEEGLIATNEIASLTFTALGNSIKTAFLSNPLGWLAIGITTVVTAMDLFNSKSKDFTQTMEEMKNLDKDIKDVDTLSNQYSQLTKQIEDNNRAGKDSKELKSQLVDIEKQLAEKVPGATTAYDDQNNALATNINLVKQLNDEKKKQLEAQSLSVKESMDDDIKGINDRLESALKQRDELVNKRLNGEQITKAVNIGHGMIKFENVDNNEVSSQLDKLNESIKADEDSVNKYNEAIKTLNSLTGSNYPLIKNSSQVIDDNTKSTIDNTNAKTDNASVTDTQNAKSQEDLAKAYQTSTEKIKDYNQILHDLKSNDESLKSSTIQNIIKNHQELLPYLSNERVLIDKVSQSLVEEKNTANDTYRQMMENSEEYYRSNIQGTDTIKKALGSYYNQLSDDQKRDLANSKTLAQAKFAVEKHLIEALADAWAKYTQAITNVMSTHSKLASQMDNGDDYATMQLSKIINASVGARQAIYQAQQIQSQIDGINVSFNGITANISSPSQYGDNYAGSNAKSASSAADAVKKAEEDMKNNVQAVEQAITEIIKKEYDKRKNLIDDHYNALKDSLQKEKDLYDKNNAEDDYQKNLKKEQETLNGINTSIVNSQRDTSFAGQARTKDLIQQRIDQQDKIDQMILDHTRKTNDQLFDDKIAQIDKEKEAQQKALDNQFSDENISKMVNEGITAGQIKGIGDVLTAYKNFQDTYNSGLTASGSLLQTEFIDKWAQVQKLINGTSGVSIGVSFNNLPKYDVGTNYVPKDQLAVVHQGEAILPKNLNIFNRQGLSNFFNNFAPKIPNVSTINRNNSPSVNFNEPFMVIQGGINSEIDLNNAINTATDKVTRKIMQTFNDQGIYYHG